MECRPLIAACLLISCRGCEPDTPLAPPRGTVAAPPSAIPLSSVQVPLSINIVELQTAIQEQSEVLAGVKEALH